MTDRPILFSAPMVRALLDGRKTQTRRIIKPRGHASLFNNGWSDSYILDPGNAESRADEVRFEIGDRLYVREAWRAEARLDKKAPRDIKTNYPGIKYIATDEPDDFGIEGKYRQAMHMPRWASRITLIVTDVRVERLQNISEEDAIAEGIVFTDFGTHVPQGRMSVDGGLTFHPFKPKQHNGWHAGSATKPEQCLATPVSAYANLWNAINGVGAWEENPWVVAVTFEVLKQNIDEVQP